MAPTASQALSLIPSTVAPTTSEIILINIMGVFWLLAVVIAVWGAMREGRRAEYERRRIGDDEMAGPTPGIEGVLDHWGVWSLTFLAAGFIALALFSKVVTL